MRAQNGQKVLLGTRPEHLAPDAAGALAAKVEVIEPTGADTMLMCTLGGQELVVVVRDRVTLRPGDPVRLTPAGDKLHVFDAAGGKSLAA
jgi:multiple sugar transport system ATP-binding protein